MTKRESRWTSAMAPLPAVHANSDSQKQGPGLSPENRVDSPNRTLLDTSLTWTATAGRPPGAASPHLGEREQSILQALDQYRYLDRAQIEQLYFQGSRPTQMKLRELVLRQLVLRWDRRRDGSALARPSVYVLSPRGAALLSRQLNMDPRPAVTRARLASTRAYHLVHDVEANGFFVSLATASADLPDEGLYQWLGEATCRQTGGVEGSPSSDGWGRYLFSDRELFFDLEWDRGTEHERRLRQKATAYVTYFRGRRDARAHHVLFVAPTDRREAELRRVIADVLPRTAECCRFWTATAPFLEVEGPLGRIWLEVGSPEPCLLAVGEMAGCPRSNRQVADCIGKPRWWERRPGGGEGA